MAYIASLASLASTSLAPSQTSALASIYATASARANPVQVADLAQYDSMNTKGFNHFAYSLNYTQTGCFSQGALPVALASEDICLPGWYCTYILSLVRVSLSPFLSRKISLGGDLKENISIRVNYRGFGGGGREKAN